MHHALHTFNAPRKAIGPWVCLAAVLLLWTPMLASAWAARGMVCCARSMCAAHGKTKSSGTSEAAKDQAPMECEHSQGAGMVACTISCCHEQSTSLVSVAIYVLPKPLAISLPAETANLKVAVKYEEVLQAIAPPSPPPKRSSL